MSELREHVEYLQERVQTFELANSKLQNQSDEYWNNWYSSDLLYPQPKRQLDELQEKYDTLKFKYDNKLIT